MSTLFGLALATPLVAAGLGWVAVVLHERSSRTPGNVGRQASAER